MHIALAIVRPHSTCKGEPSDCISTRGGAYTNLVRLHKFVVLEWVEIVLDMYNSLLDDPGAKEWIGHGRRLRSFNSESAFTDRMTHRFGWFSLWRCRSRRGTRNRRCRTLIRQTKTCVSNEGSEIQ